MNYVIASTVGLYSYNTATKEFTLLNETRSSSRYFNVRFTNNTIFYINYYSRSNYACAGIDIYVSETRNDPELQPQPQPQPESQPESQPIPYTAQTELTGDSKSISAGAIAGIVVAVFTLFVLTIILCK